MIEARELRIGNFVWEDYSGEMIVDGIINTPCPLIDLKKKQDLPSGRYRYDARTIKGIPLTPKWLERAGFEKHESIFKNSINPYWVKDAVVLTFNYSPPENTYLPGIGFTSDGMYFVGHHKNWINNVHQLQNLFYSLSGNELEIK